MLKSWCSVLLGFSLGSVLSIPAQAQITLDRTTNTILVPTGNGIRIEQGNRAGGNLFHSFAEFSVLNGTEAFFNNANDIVNIFSRVTGGNISSIDGLIRANGNANLFLINPAGIIFGENASLNIGGSFLGSTADSIIFADNVEFLATDSDNPPLLTIHMPIGLGFQDEPTPITNRSFVRNSTNTDFVGLEVLPGANLTLVGGDINFEGGEATALGGRVELGGLSEAGIVTINENGSLSFPEGVSRADVTLTNLADVDVRAAGGSIAINARNIDINRSRLRAGIEINSGAREAQAGDINLNATDSISLSQRSSIANTVAETGVGNSGGIDITTANLSLTQGSRVNSAIEGRGNAGKINIQASGTISADEFSSGIFSQIAPTGVGNSGGIDITTANLSLTQGGVVIARTFGQGNTGKINIAASGTISADGIGSGIFNQVRETGVGGAGGIDITTANLSLTQGSVVNVSTFGQGNAGKITINAADTISAGIGSGIISGVGETGVGDTGGIDITTTNLSLTQGSRVDATTFGQGNAGKITLNASETISADGIGSGIFNQVRETGVGDAGGIDITTANLSLTQGSRVDATTFGQGNAGKITLNAADTISAGIDSGIISRIGDTGVGNSEGIDITTANLSLTQGSVVNSTTEGQGNAGRINIKASSIISADGFGSGIFNQIAPIGVGNSERIDITTANLSLKQGGRVDASTFGQGNAGKITLNAADTISIEGETQTGFRSGIFSRVISTAKGNSEGIDITTTNLLLTQGGILSASTFGQGNAGKITIDASSTIAVDGETKAGIGSGIFSAVEESGVGKAEGIDITTTNLSLTQGGVVSTSTFGQGNGGEIMINAADTISVQGKTKAGIDSSIFSQVASTAKGNSEGIDITTTDLFLTQGGMIDATTFGQGNAGKIKINALGTTSADGLDSGIFSQVASTAKGNSGEIDLTTTDLSLTKGSILNASTFGQGNAGKITINALGIISADGESLNGFGSGIISQVAPTGIGNSGGIDITTTDLSLTQGGVVNASTFGEGDAGKITINALGTITAEGESINGVRSGIISQVAPTAKGNSGGIDITTTNLSLVQGSQVNASTVGQGNAGAINIRVLDIISADGIGSGIFSAAGEFGEGDAQGINIKTNNLSLTNNAQISVESLGQGNAGNLLIQANSMNLNNGASLLASTPVGKGGNINLQVADNLILQENSIISAQASGDADGGNIDIEAKFVIAFPNQNNDIIASAAQGQGGDINITAEGVFGLVERNNIPPNETNDIDASSEFGLDGQVNINVIEEDIDRDLVPNQYPFLPLSEVLAKSCLIQQGRKQNRIRLNVVGKGGLSMSPDSGIDEGEDDIMTTRVFLYSEQPWQPQDPLIQVNRIITTPDGKLLGVTEVEAETRCLD